MSSFNQTLERMILDHVWGGQATSLPSAVDDWYIGLSTTTINNDGTGITEPSALDGYARATVLNSPAEWPAATGGGPSTKQNANEISFPMATGSWGTVTHFFFSDSPTLTAAANIFAFAALDVPRAIEANDTASFAPSAITITLD